MARGSATPSHSPPGSTQTPRHHCGSHVANGFVRAPRTERSWLPKIDNTTWSKAGSSSWASKAVTTAVSLPAISLAMLSNDVVWNRCLWKDRATFEDAGAAASCPALVPGLKRTILLDAAVPESADSMTQDRSPLLEGHVRQLADRCSTTKWWRASLHIRSASSRVRDRRGAVPPGSHVRLVIVTRGAPKSSSCRERSPGSPREHWPMVWNTPNPARSRSLSCPTLRLPTPRWSSGRSMARCHCPLPGATLYTASEASPSVAQILVQAIPAAIAHLVPHATVTITDLAPNPVDDPKGTAIPTALIPLTMTSIAAGALIGLLSRDRLPRLMALLGYAILAGLLATVAVQGMLGGLTGAWFSNELVISLGAGSIAAVTCGLTAIAGIAGILVTLLVAWFFGFAFSGATTAWQLMPAPWGQIAQYLPVGATNTGLRSVAFFDGARAGGAADGAGRMGAGRDRAHLDQTPSRPEYGVSRPRLAGAKHPSRDRVSHA